MDRNTIIGIFLIFLIFVVFGIINQPSQEELEKARRKRDSLEKVLHDSLLREAQKRSTMTTPPGIGMHDTSVVSLPDSVLIKKMEEKYGLLGRYVIGDTSFIVLENQKLRVTFINKGARPYKVELKEFRTYDSLPIVLWQGDSTIFSLNFFAQNRSIRTQDLFFEVLTNDSLLDASADSQGVVFQVKAGENRYLQFVYSLEPHSYKLNFTIQSKNFHEITSDRIDYMWLEWKLFVSQFEKNKDFEQSNTTIYYKYDAEEMDYLSETSDDKEDVRTKIQWVAFKQQFFSSVLAAQDPFLNATVESKIYQGSNPRILKELYSEMALGYSPQETEKKSFVFYFGPNHFHTLKKQEIPDLHKIIPLGWGIFGWINRFLVIPVFNFLDNYIASYGIIILILTILIKIILFPLTYKSYLATAKMRILKPQVDEITQKIPQDKPLERQQAIMNLYKRAGVNPMGGCLPMLLQLPILFAMFKFFPSSFELRQQSFLWADDLSTYDSVLDLGFTIPFYGDHVSLFCLLMTVSTIIYTYQQNKLNPQNTTMPSIKIISYMMPVMFLFIFNNFSAGLSYYYFLANVITFGQMYIIRRFVDEDKLLEQINENKKKPIKKSRLQERLEQLARQRMQNAKKKK